MILGLKPEFSNAEGDELTLIEDRLARLRSEISDEGHALDAYKAKTAAAMGGGCFLFLLAMLAIYDLYAGKTGVWLSVGITRDLLTWVGGALAAVSLALLALALLRQRRRDRTREARLAELELEYADLLDRKESLRNP
jgi:hypothetical protein